MKKGSKNHPTDPHADREASRYENPIPSRELILTLLENESRPLTRSKLAKKLGLTESTEQDALGKRLSAMRRDGQLIFNRKDEIIPLGKVELIKGKVIGHRDGYGFVKPLETEGDDLYLGPRQMRQVFDGDIVVVREKSLDHRGRREAAVVEVLVRNTTDVVGRFYQEGGIAYLRPDNARISQDILLPPDIQTDSIKPVKGQIIVGRIQKYPDNRHLATAAVTEILGNEKDPGLEIDIALRNHDVPYQWPDEVDRECQQLPTEVEADDIKNRTDLRHLHFVTIDGEDARDFDDAVYCEDRKGKGWTLWVAIADVSHYVQPDTGLDREAVNRGTSVYFPASVIPMLPESISNGLCSLMPNVDRLAMVCEMNISFQGAVEKFQFYPAVIHSHGRLTYKQVAAALEKGELRTPAIEQAEPYLQRLYSLYQTLHKSRAQRGAIEFDSEETQIIFSADRKIEKIVPVIRNDAHRLIEECMLAANTSAAHLLESSPLHCLYRVHEGPTEKKLEPLRAWLGEMALSLPGGKKPRPEDYQSLILEIKDRPDAHIIESMLLRSMSQAVYQPENIGHFGLNYPSYTHFTSPIRRYPDLLVHRAIKKLSAKGKYNYDLAAMVQLGEHCSMTERRADDATRDVESWLKCEFLQDRIGETFGGVISGIAAFGFFVELEKLFIEGLVHISNLKSDYYHFDAGKQRLIGERTRQSFHLGDKVEVQLVEVNLEERKIDFELINQVSRPGGRIRKRKAKESSKSSSKKEKQGENKKNRPKNARKKNKKPRRGK